MTLRCRPGDVVQFAPPRNTGYMEPVNSGLLSMAGMVTRTTSFRDECWGLSPVLHGSAPFLHGTALFELSASCDEWLVPLRDGPGVDEVLERVGKPAPTEALDVVRELRELEA